MEESRSFNFLFKQLAEGEADGEGAYFIHGCLTGSTLGLSICLGLFLTLGLSSAGNRMDAAFWVAAKESSMAPRELDPDCFSLCASPAPGAFSPSTLNG